MPALDRNNISYGHATVCASSFKPQRSLYTGRARQQRFVDAYGFQKEKNTISQGKSPKSPRLVVRAASQSCPTHAVTMPALSSIRQPCRGFDGARTTPSLSGCSLCAVRSSRNLQNSNETYSSIEITLEDQDRVPSPIRELPMGPSSSVRSATCRPGYR